MTIKKPNNITQLKVLVRGKKLSVDNLVYIAIINPILALPQLYLIIKGEDTGVSLISWGAFLIIAIVWLVYGFKHKIRPMIMVQMAWIAVDAAIVTSLIYSRYL